MSVKAPTTMSWDATNGSVKAAVLEGVGELRRA
jgi:hypothetical protein